MKPQPKNPAVVALGTPRPAILTVARLASWRYATGYPGQASRGDNATILVLLTEQGHAWGIPDRLMCFCCRTEEVTFEGLCEECAAAGRELTQFILSTK